MRRRFPIFVPIASLWWSACDTPMSTLTGAGREGRAIAGLTWFLVAASGVVFVVVIAILLRAIGRNRRAQSEVDLSPRSLAFPVVGGALVPAIILFGLFIASIAAERGFPEDTGAPLRFTVTGKQWWWDVRYDGTGVPLSVHLANEIHVPVGRAVELQLLSDDVIHSFWVPQLHGKIDLIPGDTNAIRFTAIRAGVYRGQCAEYCGLEHAHMAFVVVAEPPAQFARWLAIQQQDGAVRGDSTARAGARLVASSQCALCHTIRGTTARGQIGPDLTHIGSRQMLAAGTLPNDAATMEAWITNAPSLKPGTQMPALPRFTGEQLRAMTAYLESLQ